MEGKVAPFFVEEKGSDERRLSRRDASNLIATTVQYIFRELGGCRRLFQRRVLLSVWWTFAKSVG